MKKSIRSIVLLSAIAAAGVPSFAAMTGTNPRPQLTAQEADQVNVFFSGVAGAVDAYSGFSLYP